MITFGFIIVCLGFVAYEGTLLYFVMKNRKHEEELYWKQENDRLENP